MTTWADFAYEIAEPTTEQNADQQMVLAAFQLLGAPFIGDDDVRVFVKSVAMSEWLASERVIGKRQLESRALYKPLLDAISNFADFAQSDFAVDAGAKWLPDKPVEIYGYVEQMVVKQSSRRTRGELRVRDVSDRREAQLLRVLRTALEPLLRAAQASENALAESLAAQIATIVVATASAPVRIVAATRTSVQRSNELQDEIQTQLQQTRNSFAMHFRLAVGLE